MVTAFILIFALFDTLTQTNGKGYSPMERYSEEMKLWLSDLAHGNLNDEMILKGFIKHYVLYNLVIDNIVDDIHFHTFYGTDGVIRAKESILRVLNNTI